MLNEALEALVCYTFIKNIEIAFIKIVTLQLSAF